MFSLEAFVSILVFGGLFAIALFAAIAFGVWYMIRSGKKQQPAVVQQIVDRQGRPIGAPQPAASGAPQMTTPSSTSATTRHQWTRDIREDDDALEDLDEAKQLRIAASRGLRAQEELSYADIMNEVSFTMRIRRLERVARRGNALPELPMLGIEGGTGGRGNSEFDEAMDEAEA